MEYVILGLLMFGSSTLYSLNKSFEQGISMFFSPSLGSINSAVKRLAEKGHLAQEDTIENGRVKKILSLTPMGQEIFIDWMFSPLDLKNLEVGFLSRLYFVGLIEGLEKRKLLVEGMKADILRSKEELDQAASELDRVEVPRDYQTIFMYQKKVLKYGRDTHAYALEWIDQLLKEME